MRIDNTSENLTQNIKKLPKLVFFKGDVDDVMKFKNLKK